MAFTEEEEDDLKARLEWQAGLDMGVCWLSAEEARSMEPGLGEGIRGALYSPQEGHLNSRRLVRAFAREPREEELPSFKTQKSRDCCLPETA